MLTTEQKQRIDKLFDLWVQHQGAGGQLVVVHKGETVYEQCYCYADIEEKTPMTQESLFTVASVSKQIVAMSIMILHDRGLLNIADDIRKYLPELVQFSEPVTISHMLHHTSGLREIFELTSLNTAKEGDPKHMDKLRMLAGRQKALNFEPGSQFSYCNTGYTLLATIVERITGMNLNEFAKKNIFEPLGMEHSFFGGCLPEEEIPTRVFSYHDDGTTYNKITGYSRVYGSGGLTSTCRDMVKFMPQYANPTLVSKETMELYQTIPPLADGTVTNYACGVRINELLGHKYLHHGGVTAGFRTFTVIFPDDELVIALFTNTYNIPIETAGRDVARIVLGLPERTTENLDDFVEEKTNFEQVTGYYRSKGGSVYDIRAEGEKLFIKCNGHWAPLYNVRGNLWKLGRRNISFVFGETVRANLDGSNIELRKLTDQPENPEQYCGTYYSDETMGAFTVQVEEGKLFATTPTGSKQELHLLEEDLFCYGPMAAQPKKLRFNKADGQVYSMTYNAPQITAIEFKKV